MKNTLILAILKQKYSLKYFFSLLLSNIFYKITSASCSFTVQRLNILHLEPSPEPTEKQTSSAARNWITRCLIFHSAVLSFPLGLDAVPALHQLRVHLVRLPAERLNPRAVKRADFSGAQRLSKSE